MATEEQIGEKNMLEDRLAKVAAISSLYASEGGAILVRELLKDVMGLMDTICAKHRVLTLAEFVGIGAEMKSKMDLAQAIAHSKENALQARQELADLIVVIEKDSDPTV